MKKPHPLKPGDTIGIAASSSPFNKEDFLSGVANLEKLGFKVFYQDDIFDKNRYLAGSDERRGKELIQLIADPNIKAILFARGGYGLLRLLPLLDRIKITSLPKIILGYSDITSLLIYLHQVYGWVSFYGPVVAKDFSTPLNSQTLESFIKAVTETNPLNPFCFSETETLKGGKAKGILVGGCLSLVVASLGTPYEINTKDKILFLEDVNEKPYSIDRLLTQLLLAGKLDEVRGILFGHFSKGGDLFHIQEAIVDVLQNISVPVLSNFPAGHGPVKITLPLGVELELDADKKTVFYLEGACQKSS